MEGKCLWPKRTTLDQGEMYYREIEKSLLTEHGEIGVKGPDW